VPLPPSPPQQQKRRRARPAAAVEVRRGFGPDLTRRAPQPRPPSLARRAACGAVGCGGALVEDPDEARQDRPRGGRKSSIPVARLILHHRRHPLHSRRPPPPPFPWRAGGNCQRRMHNRIGLLLEGSLLFSSLSFSQTGSLQMQICHIAGDSLILSFTIVHENIMNWGAAGIVPDCRYIFAMYIHSHKCSFLCNIVKLAS
jgi:hypothetical protein